MHGSGLQHTSEVAGLLIRENFIDCYGGILQHLYFNQALQSIRYGGMSANEMREYMALIDKRSEVEILYANNAPIEYIVKSPSVDSCRPPHDYSPSRCQERTARQNLVKDILFKIVGALNSIIDFIVMTLED